VTSPGANTLVARSLVLLSNCLLCACVMPRTQDLVDRPQEPRLEDNRVVLADGATLPLVSWHAADASPRAVIVAVHGLNQHAAVFADIAEHLAVAGFATYAFDQRGFGATEPRGIWAGEDLLADDVWQVTRLVRLRHPGVPVYGFGESLGGAVLLHALGRHPQPWLDGAVLSAPAVWNRRAMPWYQRMALPILAHTWRGLKLSGRSVGRLPTDDPEVLRGLRADPLVIQKTRVDVLWGVANLMDAVTAVPQRFELPTLILYGEHDEIVPPRAMCAWVTSLDPSGRWQFALYPNGWHLLTRDLDGATVRADLTKWFLSPGVTLAVEADSGAPKARICDDAKRP